MPAQLWRRYWPAVPADVRDELALMRFAYLRTQMPLLFMTIIGVVMVASLAATPDAPFLIKIGLPALLLGLCALRLYWWLRAAPGTQTAARAADYIRRSPFVAAAVCSIASAWTLTAWFESSGDQRAYYPLFLVVGSLAAAICLSSIRCSASMVLLCGIAPVVVVLGAFGNVLDQVTAGVILLACLYVFKLLQSLHDQLVRTLVLQRDMRTLAATDPLTGLPNRRALYAAMDQRLSQRLPMAVILLDLDGFKPVNDRHGHAAGDDVLAQVAARLRDAAGDDAVVYRLGGDEFAALLPVSDRKPVSVLSTTLLAAIAAPFVIDTIRFTVGASVGSARASTHDSANSLLARADTRLYAAKSARTGRDRGSHRRLG